MKSTALTVLLLILLNTPAFAGQRLVLATDTFAPYYYYENGQDSGLINALLRLTFEELKIPYTIKYYPWKRALMMAETGISDAIQGISKNPERDRSLIFTQEPLVMTSIVLFHRKDSEFEYTGLNSLKDKRVGVIRGYSYGPEFDNCTLFKKDESNSIQQNFNKLLVGRIDLVVAYKAVGILNLHRAGLNDRIKYSANPVTQIPLYIAFSRKVGNTELADQFNTALKRIKKSAKCKEAVEALRLPSDIPCPCEVLQDTENTDSLTQ